MSPIFALECPFHGRQQYKSDRDGKGSWPLWCGQCIKRGVRTQLAALGADYQPLTVEFLESVVPSDRGLLWRKLMAEAIKRARRAAG